MEYQIAEVHWPSQSYLKWLEAMNFIFILPIIMPTYETLCNYIPHNPGKYYVSARYN